MQSRVIEEEKPIGTVLGMELSLNARICPTKIKVNQKLRIFVAGQKLSMHLNVFPN